MITDYKVWPVRRKNPHRSTKTFAKNRRRRRTFGRDPPATTWSTTKSSVVSRDFHPPPRFSFFRRDPNFVESSQRFWKESPESSKTFETTLEFCTRVPKQRAPNLHTCKTCQTCQLRKTCKTCVAGLHTVCNRLQQCRYKGGGGRSSERCSEGPDVLLYITEITHNINNILQASGSERKLYLRQNPRRSTTTPYRRRVPATPIDLYRIHQRLNKIKNRLERRDTLWISI